MADSMMDRERTRRTDKITEEELERRVGIAHMMINVQKELLATHKPVKVCCVHMTSAIAC